MALPSYSVRTEAVDEGFVAYIDLNNAPCIRQPNLPGLNGFFATETEAKEWADGHAQELQTAFDEGVAAAALKKEREEAAHQANLAMVAILERLTNPTA